MYQIKLSRSSAALYLAFEYGIRRTVNELKKYDGFFIPLPATFKRRKDANYRLSQINMIVAYQKGRLRMRLNDSHGTVQEIKK